MSITLYNPDKKRREELIGEFVLRTEIFEQIVSDLANSSMQHPEQHYLITGQRGSGKSTLLSRIRYAVEDDPALFSRLLPIPFTEEQYQISELGNVWEYVAAYLEEHYGFEGITTAILKQVDHPDFESKAFETLLNTLDQQKKNILLLIDNFGDLLAKFDRLEIHRFREILQTRQQLRLIAGSTTVPEGLHDYRHPLFEFFKVFQLKGLTYQESQKFLLKLAEIHGGTKNIASIVLKTPARLEAIRIISGGLPRFIALLFQIYINPQQGDVIHDLELMLDVLTPFYKHRMDDLSSQQQKIVHAVAMNWDAISVKELKEILRMDNKIISAQLGQLEKNEVIEKRPTNTKNHLYLLQDRFFNIWYLMRYGKKQDHQRVIGLIKLLERWSNEPDLKTINPPVTTWDTGKLMATELESLREIAGYLERTYPPGKQKQNEEKVGYASKKIIRPTEQVFTVIDELISKKKWEQLSKYLQKIEPETNAQSDRLFKSLAYISSSDFSHYIESKNQPYAAEYSMDEAETIPTLYLEYLLWHSSRELDQLAKSDQVNNFAQAICKIYYFINTDRTEATRTDPWFEQFIMRLISLKYYHLVLSLFEQELFSIDKDKFKLCYYLALYLSKDEDPDTIRRLGNELQDIIIAKAKDFIVPQKLH